MMKSRIVLIAVLLGLFCLPVASARAQGGIDLLDGLSAYWTLDEESGVRYDSHGSYDLTDNNTVGYATGVIGNAASFVAANTESLSHVDADGLEAGENGLTISAWIRLNSSVTGYLVSRWISGNNGSSWCLYYSSSNGRLYLYESPDGVNFNSIYQNFSLSEWNFVVAWFGDGSYHMQINNSSIVTGTADLYADSVVNFTIGAAQSTGYSTSYIDEVGLWQRVLTTDERAALYNDGNGLAYSEFEALGPTPTPTTAPTPTPDPNHPSTPQPASLDAMSDAGEEVLAGSAGTILPMIIGLAVGMGIVVAILRFMRWL
jgi:hypothetical protein